LRQAVASIHAQHGDLVVFTGDLQNKEPTEIEPFCSELSRLKAKDGVYSVLGNHDYAMYLDVDLYQQARNLEATVDCETRAGWHVLINQRHKIRRGGDSIYIAGMENDGEGRFPQLGDLVCTLHGLSRESFVVMLEHDPTSWRRKILPHSHVQLTLSGHTHGGQISFLGWSPASLKYKEYTGLYSLSGRYLYVSNGLSGVVPFRFGTLPEISVFTLRTSKSSVNK
jgi:predicted MPP superfamily phosphohydrolase